MIYDVFQKGLKRGAERLAYDPAKRYFFVEHPEEGWRVYLRACTFLHERPTEGSCIDPFRFLVVKRRDKPATGKEWEPPKGQMEGKDGLRNPNDSILALLRENVKREVAEESRIRRLQGLDYTGLVFQGREPDYPPNHFFQYHIFRAQVTRNEWMRASSELDWYRQHPLAFDRLKRDKKEKDALAWYSPSETKVMGRWSPKLVAMYLNHFT